MAENSILSRVPLGRPAALTVVARMFVVIVIRMTEQHGVHLPIAWLEWPLMGVGAFCAAYITIWAYDNRS